MKKILLSAAVIAASGAYVAYEDHGGVPSLSADATVGAPSAAYAAPAAVEPRATAPTLDQAPVPVAPQRAPTSASLPSAPALPKPTTKLASAAPTAAEAGTDAIGSIIAYAAPTPPQPSPAEPKAAPSAPQPAAVVPLPLPRPADAPQPGAATSSATRQDVLLAQTVAATQSVAQAQGAYRNGTYKGVSANAYYGRVQVEAIVSNGRLASIRMLDYPRDRRRSLYIAQQSLPVLEQEAISAQSADIDTVSGATLTSEAFMKSLDSALATARAGGSNA